MAKNHFLNVDRRAQEKWVMQPWLARSLMTRFDGKAVEGLLILDRNNVTLFPGRLAGFLNLWLITVGTLCNVSTGEHKHFEALLIFDRYGSTRPNVPQSKLKATIARHQLRKCLPN